MLSSPEATPPPLALRHPHLPIYALISIASCFAIGLAAYVELFAPGPRAWSPHAPPPRIAAAYEALHELAFTAFPLWKADHPDRACPASIEELARYTNTPTHSPYEEQPFTFSCEGGGIVVVDLDNAITSNQGWEDR